MNETRLTSAKGKPHQFNIPKDPQFADEEEITLVLPDTVKPEDYEVVKKPRPTGIPDKWNNRPVVWINCFGVKKNKVWANIEYQIIVTPRKNKILVYFNGKAVVPFADSDLTLNPSGYPGKLSAKLRMGDPPVGWGTNQG